MMRASLVLVVLLAACGDNDATNRAPTVGAFTLTTQEDLPVTRSAEASDLDGDALVAAVPLPPDHGTVTVNGLSLTYTPEPDFHGADQFALVISDGEADASITVDVTVTPVNDPAVGGSDSLATNEDTPRVVPVELLLANDSDVDEDPFTITAVGDATNGTIALADGTVTFTPTADFVGGGSFTYTINDGTVDTVVDVAVVVGGLNDTPVANNDTVTTLEDTAVTIPGATLLANDTDVDGQTLTISAVSGAVGGTVVLNGGSPIFTPSTNALAGSFVYTATDGIATDTATVTVTITAVNDGPDATNDTATTDEDTAVAISVLGNDTDPDSTPTISGVSNAQNGTPVVTGNTITFTPNANFHGTATFDYTITDGTLSDTATVTVTVNAVNDVPVAVDDTGSTDAATPITFTDLTANDTDPDIATDGQTLTVTAVANAVNGTVVLSNGQPIFTPTSTQDGSFEYTVSDGNGGTDIGAVTITINQANVIPPTAGADTVAQIDVAIAYPHATFLANDSDGGDGGALVITAVGNATNGTVSLEATTITFTPTAGFTGAASFEYTLSDGNVVTATGTVTVNVTDCGDGVISGTEACDDGGNAATDGCSATCTVEPGFTCDNDPAPSVCTVATLASFTFTGATGSEATRTAETVNGLTTAPAISRGSGVSGSAGANAFAATGWTTGDVLLADDFFTFTVTPNVGGTISLTQLTFDERRSGTGPRLLSVRSSLDNFATDVAAFTIPDDDLTRNRTVTLPAAFLNVSAPIELRFFGFDSEAEGGSWRLDNINVFGSATP